MEFTGKTGEDQRYIGTVAPWWIRLKNAPVSLLDAICDLSGCGWRTIIRFPPVPFGAKAVAYDAMCKQSTSRNLRVMV
jgi:hypothetical protein